MLELATENRPPIAGPQNLTPVKAVAAGAWTDIVSIIAPTEASPGDTVDIQVRVKNLATFSFYIAVTAQQGECRRRLVDLRVTKLTTSCRGYQKEQSS